MHLHLRMTNGTISEGNCLFCENQVYTPSSGLVKSGKKFVRQVFCCLPQDINDKLMVHKFSLPGKNYVTIISGYAPTMANPDKVKDKCITLGDCNASVFTDHKTWKV